MSVVQCALPLTGGTARNFEWDVSARAKALRKRQLR